MALLMTMAEPSNQKKLHPIEPCRSYEYDDSDSANAQKTSDLPA